MSLDVHGLRSTIRNIEQRIGHLQQDAVRLRQIAAAAESEHGDADSTLRSDLGLPPEVVVTRASVVAEYVRVHPGLGDVVREMAAALIEEFRGEASEIELTMGHDEYVDENYLVFMVRVGIYDAGFMDRVNRVAAQFDARLAQMSGWVVPTTDFAHPG